METKDIKAQSVRDGFEIFDDTSVRVKSFMDKNRHDWIPICITFICCPCIFSAMCVESIFSPRKKVDVLLEKD